MRGGEFDNFDFLCIISPLLERGRLQMDKTVNEIYPDYFDFLKQKYKITTLRNIQYKFNNYLLPYFGNKKIKNLDIEEYINFISSCKSLNYSNSFYESISAITKTFYNYLSFVYKIKGLPDNIDNFISCKNNSINKKEPNTWTIREFHTFIKKVKNPIYHALFNVLFYAGLRKSEAMALKISDFKNNTLFITKSITKDCYNGERQLLSTKNGKSREIKIDWLLSHELKKLIKYYNKNYNNFNENFFLFGGDKPIAPTTLERKKNEYCKIANVKRIRIHDFRHSHATILYNKHVDIKTIQSRLGHASVSTTLNTYVHNDKKQEKRLIKTINLIRI